MNSKFAAVSMLALQLAVVSIASIASGAAGAAKEINFGWPSGEGWSSQPYKVAQGGAGSDLHNLLIQRHKIEKWVGSRRLAAPF